MAEEIVVTEEMVEAGRRELRGWFGLHGLVCPDDVYWKSLYRAMRALEPRRSHEWYTDRRGFARCAVCGEPENGLMSKVYRPCPGPIPVAF